MILVRGLTKYYGRTRAIEEVSFTVDRGQIAGLLGPNGAGKSTTIRILCAYLPPTRGFARIAGHDVFRESLTVRGLIGYMPENVPLYTDMTVHGYLEFWAALRGIHRHARGRRVKEVMERCGITPHKGTLIQRLSKGYRQRVGLAQALLHDPEVLILDEPTIGLDPRQVLETRELIRQLQEDHTVLMSTHILGEATSLCEKVIIMDRGTAVAEGNPRELNAVADVSQIVKLQVLGPKEEIIRRLSSIDGVLRVIHEGAKDPHSYTLECREGIELRHQISSAMVEGGHQLLEIRVKETNLEGLFMKLTEQKPPQTQ